MQSLIFEEYGKIKNEMWHKLLIWEISTIFWNFQRMVEISNLCNPYYIGEKKILSKMCLESANETTMIIHGSKKPSENVNQLSQSYDNWVAESEGKIFIWGTSNILSIQLFSDSESKLRGRKNRGRSSLFSSLRKRFSGSGPRSFSQEDTG